MYLRGTILDLEKLLVGLSCPTDGLESQVDDSKIHMQ